MSDVRNIVAKAAYKGETIARLPEMDFSSVDWADWWEASAAMPLSGTPFVRQWNAVADEVLAALTAAGYRILGPDELDPVTRASIAAWHEGQAQGYRDNPPLPGEDSYEVQIRFHEASAGIIRNHPTALNGGGHGE